ncbi:MAG: carboxypeptidase regulatory-like domain-containing protein [Polyangiaceae bacterium]|nr:carboxypeptidase regulatory-like domain-containing protein [Polyangiaceae bacterium]
MPGVFRVGVPTPVPSGVRVAGSGGYAYTEAQSDADGTHHRLMGKLAAVLSPAPAFLFGGNLSGRYDKHPEGDSGLVGDPTVMVRWLATDTAPTAASPWSFGVDMDLMMPGGEAPSLIVDALTPSMSLLLSHTSGSLTLAARGGYRLDNSAAAMHDIERLSDSDRLALGLSEVDAVLAGIAMSYRSGKTEYLAELSADLLVGDGAPDMMQSPMRVGAGVRHAFSDTLSGELFVDVTLSDRPALLPTDVVIPVEPRSSVWLGLRYGPAAPTASTTDTEEEKPVEEKPEETEAPAAAATPTSSAKVSVVDSNGATIPGATVVLVQGDKKITLKAGEGGALRAEGVPLGKATLQVSAESFVSQSIDVSLEKGKALQTKIQMEPAIPPGQVRGLVRSFRGRGIAATIVILSKEGGDAVATVQAGKDGHFRVGVEPGSYEVSVEAAGYKSQKRKVRVEENGVTVLNVDLRGGK